MQWVKQSTVFTARIGPILDASGAEYNGALIGDLSRSKNGTTTVMAAGSTLTYDANGYYSLVTIAGDSDTLGRLTITCNKSTYQMPPKEYMVLTAKTFDALVTNAADAAGGLCDLQRILGTAPTATTAGILDVNVKNYGNQQALIDANNLPKVDVEDILGVLYSGAAGFFIDWNKVQNKTSTVVLSGTTIGTITTYTGNTPQTGDNYLIVNSGSFGNVDFTSTDRTTLNAISTSLAAVPTNPILTTDTRLNHLDVDVSSRLAAAGYTVPPTATQNRQEMDSNSTKLAHLTGDVALHTDATTIESAITALGAPTQGGTYSAPPSASAIATATANALFVNGVTNKLTVNNDGSISISDVDGITYAKVITDLISFMNGKCTVVDNGNGTTTVTFYKRDGVTVSFTATYVTASGARLVTGTNP